jgi:protein phosphatase PTC7
MMHRVGRHGAQQALRRAPLGVAGQQRAFHFRAQGSAGARAFSAGPSTQRDVASAASFFLDAKAACKNKRCALGKDHSGIVANPAACGEDSFFLSPRIIGVADGVGGWNENGVDPGEISRSLMRNAGQFVRRQAELKKDVSTLDVLSYGYAQALEDDAVEAGSTTACILKIKESADGQPVLEYSNLGDSGFCIIRDGKVVFRSKFQVRLLACRVSKVATH